MGFRIQPREIDVPEEDPFRNDLLGRKEQAEVLTHLVGSIEGPCVIAVDAAWGTGKTTFLRLWGQHLCNEGFSVVEFNAWETDFAGDPFVALSTELTESLHDSTSPRLGKKIERTKELAKEVVRATLPGVVGLATSGVVDLRALLEARDGMSDYQKARKALNNFRDSLQDMAKELADSNRSRPLVVVIDELDRCRPSYAVELLEVAKHLFAVDGVVFVLALNRAELTHSIRTLYGAGFDAAGYLRRFIDVDFRLPDPDRAEFIERALDAVRISDYFERTKDRDAKNNNDENVVRDWLKRLFGSPDVNLRRVAKAIHHLGLVFASLRSDERSFALTASVALIVRTVDPDLYYEFLRGKATDAEVVDRFFSRSPELREIQQENPGCVFESLIVLAAQEVSGGEHKPIDSPLVRRYEQQVQEEKSGSTAGKHAEAVLRRFERSSDGGVVLRYGGPTGRFGFKHSVQRLELLSPGLIGDMVGTASFRS